MERAWSFTGWYCRRGDTLSGPLRPEQIKRLVIRRRLHLSDRVWERWAHGRETLFFPALVSTVVAAATEGREHRPEGGKHPPPVAVR